jgi:hypothetical protein
MKKEKIYFEAKLGLLSFPHPQPGAGAAAAGPKTSSSGYLKSILGALTKDHYHENLR